MIASAIRSLACGRESQVVAAAFVEKTVQIWEVVTCRLISQFDTVYDFGGEWGRLTMSPKGDRCVCAAWSGGRKGGVGCYEVATGEVIWHRPELKQTQSVSFSPSGDSVWWAPDAGATKQLNSVNGDPQRAILSAAKVFEGRYSKALFIVPRNKTKPYLFGESSEHRIQRRTFTVLDVAFAPDCFCIAEAGGPTTCFDSKNGVERWLYEPPHQAHIVRIEFVETLQAFFGVLYHFNAGHRSLARFDPTTGICNSLYDLPHGSWASCFSEAIGAVVTSAGAVIRLNDGRELGRLDFPQKEYPDPQTA
jgi:hypothetical protein